MLLEQTKQHILTLGDQELIEYLTAEAGTYTPDVVDFAREELQRRKLDPEHVQQLADQSTARDAEKQTQLEAAAQQPLGTLGRIISFIGGMLTLPLLPLIIAWIHFRERGQRRKISEMLKFGFMGFITIILLFLIDLLFR